MYQANAEYEQMCKMESGIISQNVFLVTFVRAGWSVRATTTSYPMHSTYKCTIALILYFVSFFFVAFIHNQDKQAHGPKIVIVLWMHCTSSTAHAKQLTALEYLCKSFSVYLKIIHLADLTVTDRIAWNDRYSQSNSNAIFCILLSTKDIKAMRSHCCCLLSLPFFIRTMPPLRDPSIGRPNNMIVDNRKRSRPNATANTFINSILILFRNG